MVLLRVVFAGHIERGADPPSPALSLLRVCALQMDKEERAQAKVDKKAEKKAAKKKAKK